jgi:hypothetical protein
MENKLKTIASFYDANEKTITLTQDFSSIEKATALHDKLVDYFSGENEKYLVSLDLLEDEEKIDGEEHWVIVDFKVDYSVMPDQVAKDILDIYEGRYQNLSLNKTLELQHEKEKPMQTYRLTIERDENAESPREWDNIGTMVCAHRRYNLGDIRKEDGNGVYAYMAEKAGINTDEWENGKIDNEELLALIKEKAYVLPLYLYDHSGITISTKPFGDIWDSGQVGFIIATKNDFDKAGINSQHIEANKKWAAGRSFEQIAFDILDGEVETYDQYLIGDVFYFSLESLDEDGDVDIELDSCGSFYGDNIKENGILDALPTDLRKMVEANGLDCYDYFDGVTFEIKQNREIELSPVEEKAVLFDKEEIESGLFSLSQSEHNKDGIDQASKIKR